MRTQVTIKKEHVGSLACCYTRLNRFALTAVLRMTDQANMFMATSEIVDSLRRIIDRSIVYYDDFIRCPERVKDICRLSKS